MTKTEYLYGKDFDLDILEKQIDVCEYKLKKLNILLKELLNVTMYARDDDRIDAILEARDWNENVINDTKNLLKEIK